MWFLYLELAKTLPCTISKGTCNSFEIFCNCFRVLVLLSKMLLLIKKFLNHYLYDKLKILTKLVFLVASLYVLSLWEGLRNCTLGRYIRYVLLTVSYNGEKEVGLRCIWKGKSRFGTCTYNVNIEWFWEISCILISFSKRLPFIECFNNILK